jgi:DNA replication and repair protein RecF
MPILLLDDIFEKIDDERSKRLLELVCSDDFGQIFITDTNKERIEEKLIALNIDCEYFETT